jgi:hypothetical protein
MGDGTATFVAALIAAIAAIIAAAFAIMGARRTNYTNAIVASRIRWISEMREDFSNLFADAERIFNTVGAQDNPAVAARDYLAASLKLRLRLNPKDDAGTLKKLDNLECAAIAACRDEDWSNFDREQMIPEIQALLKREWDKSKKEAAQLW